MKKHGRSQARERAVINLYTKRFIDSIDCDDKLANEYTTRILDCEAELNDLIRPHLRKWSLNQLNPVDLAILQVAVYELMYLDVPYPVIINEALELTKKYSTPESKNFVHKTLSNIIKEKDATK